MPSAMRSGRPTASRDADPFVPVRLGIREVRARMPPSPWLSARITIATYLTEMTSRSA